MSIDWSYLFTSFHGRISRKPYWVGIGALLGLNLLSYILLGRTGLLAFIIGIVIFLIGVAIVVKRLHDWDKSGWWALLGLLPYMNLVLVVVLGLVEGTRGPNQYGPDPKGALPPGGGAPQGRVETEPVVPPRNM